jgi:hypothetical protein
VEDFMSVAPQDEKGIKIGDYLTNFCVTEEFLFPPVLLGRSHSRNALIMDQHLFTPTSMSNLIAAI